MSKQTENLERKIEVIAIKYVCPSINHPNHALNDRIDRYPIDQIIGYGTHIIKKLYFHLSFIFHLSKISFV